MADTVEETETTDVTDSVEINDDVSNTTVETPEETNIVTDEKVSGNVENADITENKPSDKTEMTENKDKLSEIEITNANETDNSDNKEEENSTKITQIRGTARDETEIENEKKLLESKETEDNTTPDLLKLGKGWNVKQTNKVSNIKGLRGETLHLHTIIVNFIITKNVDGTTIGMCMCFCLSLFDI